MGIYARLREAYDKKGFWFLVRKIIRACYLRFRSLWLAVYLNIRPAKTFQFRGKTLKYLYRMYNHTWDNERCIEIPIAESFVANRAPGDTVLEVGNVLNLYHRFPHDVIDKYEIATGVLNEDVVDFAPQNKYSLIVSVSTMEHVGWDEEPREPEKLLRGLRNLADGCLAKGGQMFVTMPIGFNSSLDQWIREGKLPFTETIFMKHGILGWAESSREEALAAKYGSPYSGANAIIVGAYKKTTGA